MSDVLINGEIYFNVGKGIIKDLEEIKRCQDHELRLWLIGELSSCDYSCGWLVYAILDELKKRKILTEVAGNVLDLR